jgi:putative membrane protein
MPDGRAFRTLVLLAWAGFFAYLWLSGEVRRYLGPRTYWVVPFGAAVLLGAALVQLVTLRSGPSGQRLSMKQIGGLAVLLVPVIAVAMVPRAELGALAASRKSTGGLAPGAGYIAPPPPSSHAEPSFIDIHFANESASYGATRGVVDGRAIELVGFVSQPPGSPGATFQLTRFYVSCCAADAIPYSVVIDPAEVTGGFSTNMWLSVSGVLRQDGDGFSVEARDIQKVPEPQDPYLY